MKHPLWFILIPTALALFSCQKQTVTTAPQPDPLAAEIAALENTLLTAEQYRSDSLSADSVDVDGLYQTVLQRSEQLIDRHGSDSALVDLNTRAMVAYDEYLLSARTSFAAQEVLSDLDSLYQELDDSTTLAGVPDSALADTTRLTIPIVRNTKVERAISYFTKGRGRKVMERWLERAGRYEPLVKPILREVGAPEELFYLAMIESGLRPEVRSYAHAVGMWQFIAATGRAYGLNQSWWYDDRRDPVKATYAAGRHLVDLYERFGDWYLGIAGYNFNPRKIEKRLAAYNVTEFWELPRLPRQTRNYVPTFLAAVTIATNAEEYGFDITPAEPLVFDTVTVKECVDLNLVAELTGSTFHDLKELNPALLRFCTPPDVESWLLNIPAGTRDRFVEGYAQVPAEKKVTWLRHRIRSGETLSTIANRYRVSVSEIRRFNNLRGNLIRAGHSLVIPVPQNADYRGNYVASTPAPPATSRPRPEPVEDVPGREKRVHTVQQGESFWSIAQEYGVSISQLRRWNGLSSYARLIKPGQQINVWVRPGTPEPTRDSMPQPLIARQESATLESAESVPLPAGAAAGRIVHTVRSGDTLWDIAQAYNVSIRDLKRWNQKRSNILRPGDQLIIMLPE